MKLKLANLLTIYIYTCVATRDRTKFIRLLHFSPSICWLFSSVYCHMISTHFSKCTKLNTDLSACAISAIQKTVTIEIQGMTFVIPLLLVVIGCHKTHGITSSQGKTIIIKLCVSGKSTQASRASCPAVKNTNHQRQDIIHYTDRVY